MKVKLVVLLAVIFLSSVVIAGQPPLNIPVLSGKVQQTSRNSLKVNGIDYVVAKGIPAYQIVKRGNAYQQQRIDYSSIHSGNSITFKALGNVIIEVRVEER
jgi:hypothetical protein